MQSNQKYITAEHIMARLSQKHKQKNFSINEIVQWSAECSIEIVGNPDVMAPYRGVELKIEQFKALLPCNVYRLLDVYDNNDNRIDNYANDGIHIIFQSGQQFNTNDDGDQVVKVNYIGINVDTKTGYPLIPRGHELACEAYCVYNLYYEDFLTGKINGNAWSYIDNAKMIQCEAAKGGFRHYSNDDMKKYLNVVMNMIPNMKRIPMYHLDGVTQ